MHRELNYFLWPRYNELRNENSGKFWLANETNKIQWPRWFSVSWLHFHEYFDGWDWKTYLETYIPDLSIGMVVITDSSLWFRNQSHPWTNGITKRNVSYLRSRFVIGLVPRKSFGGHVCRLVRNELTRVSTTVLQSCELQRRAEENLAKCNGTRLNSLVPGSPRDCARHR